jgi:hypothetical protein
MLPKADVAEDGYSRRRMLPKARADVDGNSMPGGNLVVIPDFFLPSGTDVPQNHAGTPTRPSAATVYDGSLPLDGT